MAMKSRNLPFERVLFWRTMLMVSQKQKISSLEEGSAGKPGFSTSDPSFSGNGFKNSRS